MQTAEIVENITPETPKELKSEEWKDIGNQEVWKPIPGYEGMYEISDRANIKISKDAYIRKGLFSKENQIVKSYINKNNKNDYYRVVLHKNGDYKKFLVHRLVATTFLVNPNGFPCVNHKDLNKQNNHVSNLEWVTHKQNSQHAVKHNRFSSGENHHNTTLNKDTIDLIRLQYLSRNKSNREIQELYDLSPAGLSSIINNETWKDEEYDFMIKSNLFKKCRWMNRSRGANNTNGKLNEEKVKTIRLLYEHWDFSSLKLARLFDVGKGTILHIIHKNTWTHI